ncbi:hypothetical protein ACP70R_036461 [Stipagrostis hirtigluma subsp. patula]
MEMPQQAAGGAAPPVSPPLSPATAEANARWNPTKEQVAVLEGLYEHGVRTPTAEQIEQITARLREHGHIEGKNVFYWFQNHKARERQKQKQEGFAVFTRLLRRPPPLPVFPRPPAPPFHHGSLPPPAPAPGMAMAPPPACNNGGTPAVAVMYRAPCYMPPPQAPAADAAYYHPQQQQMAFMYPRMEIAQDRMIQAAPHLPRYYSPASFVDGGGAADVRPSRETLQLFPLHPTFVLADKARGGNGSASSSLTPTASASASLSEESESLGSPSSNGEAPPFYDFFGLHSGGGR